MNRIARWARRFGVARAVCTVLLFALVPLRLADPRPLQEVRLRTFDLFQVLRPRVQTARPVAIVDIDEDSLKEIGQWPWPRTTLADLVTRITSSAPSRSASTSSSPSPIACRRRLPSKAFAASTPTPAPNSTVFRAMTTLWPTRSSIRASSSARPARRSRRRRRKPS